MMMRKSVVICVMLWVLLGTVAPSKAVRPLGPSDRKCFVGFSVKSYEIDLGTIKSLGFKQGSSVAKFNARVVANCPHHIEASFEPFARVGGRFVIPSKNTFVVINGRGVPVGGKSVPIISSSKPTPVGGIDVPLDLKVGLENVTSYPAGDYNGTLIFTVVPGA
jgi:hypothetical protein